MIRVVYRWETNGITYQTSTLFRTITKARAQAHVLMPCTWTVELVRADT